MVNLTAPEDGSGWIPWQSDGWKYRSTPGLDLDLSPADPTFDDSSWAEGRAAFGNPTGSAHDYGVVWTHSPHANTVWIRRRIEGDGIYQIQGAFDGGYDIWWNGTLIQSGGLFNYGPIWDIPQELVTDSNVLVARHYDGDQPGSFNMIDLAIAGGGITPVRQYPRDDAYGFGSAPRQYPPPRVDRVVGGFQ